MKEIRPGIWFIAGENRGRYPYSHSLWIEGGENLLIDAGAGPALHGLTGKTGRVVLSHYHRDHVACNSFFEGASFSIHADDAAGVESREGFLRLSGLDRVDIDSYWKMVRQTNFMPTKMDYRFRDGEYIDSGNLKIRVLHLPGHTPGHCGFLVEDYNLIFSADIDLSEFGPWYGNTTSDLEQFRRSIRRLREMKPDILVTGHGRPVEGDPERMLKEYEEVLDRRDEAIIEALKKQPATLEELVPKRIIYPRHYGREILLYFERNMLEKHLDKLLAGGMAALEDNGRYEAL